MLVIDDIKKLAKMQETLLERTTSDRETNLEKYKNIVIQIDEYDFSNLCSELSQVNDHNQTLEEELVFLEQVKGTYQQLLEQQLGFRKVCELYGNDILQLSDLSLIDVEYIDNRINTINGYLINKKNIDVNKKKLEELSEKLITEENNKNLLSRRLLEFEKTLRDNFINAEGRIIVSGKLQYISVISEYNELGYDLKQLLNDNDILNMLLSDVNKEKIEIDEKLKTAEICYNNVPSVDSKQILDDIAIDSLRIKYKLTLLKIVSILAKNYDNYDLFKEKREQLLDLIKYRLNCASKLGMCVSIDPFSRIKVSEQLDMLLSLKDNSKVIKNIKKEIASLDKILDEMLEQNSVYTEQLNDTKSLMINKTSMNDIDISDVDIKLEEPTNFDVVVVMDNQVISSKELPEQFNSDIVSQKTKQVIKRVNEMMNSISLTDDKVEDVVPELVIVSQTVERDNLVVDEIVDKQDSVNAEDVLDESHNDNLSVEGDDVNQEFENSLFDYMQGTLEQVDLESEDISLEKINVSDEFDDEIFSSVDPFLETQLFTERANDDVESDVFENHDNFESISGFLEIDSDNNDQNSVYEEIKEFVNSDDEDLELKTDEVVDDEMPEAFWVTQGEEIATEKDSVGPSFDEQIDALLSNENDTKTRKLIA